MAQTLFIDGRPIANGFLHGGRFGERLSPSKRFICSPRDDVQVRFGQQPIQGELKKISGNQRPGLPRTTMVESPQLGRELVVVSDDNSPHCARNSLCLLGAEEGGSSKRAHSATPILGSECMDAIFDEDEIVTG